MTQLLKTTLIWIMMCQCCIAQSILHQSKDYLQAFEQTSSPVLTEQINRIADSCRIIGLGEVSHYTKECYELKHEIIKTLMGKGYRALILEVDFGQALIWNDYVTKGEGNLDSIIAKSGWFTYRTEEFKNLIRDIRMHNEKAERLFQLFGMEMTAMNSNLDWLKHYISKNTNQNEAILTLLNAERKVVAFQRYNEKERQDYWTLYYQLTNFLAANEALLLANSGQQNLAIARRITEIVRQYATYIAQDDFSLQVEFRDQFSARNVNWCMEQLGEENRVVLWAHNGHVAKRSVMFNYDVLGHYLQSWWGDQYYSIGFTFNQGEFGAFSNNGFKRWTMAPVDRPSLTKDFQSFSSPFLMLDIREHLKADQTLNSYLRTEQVIKRDISESYNEDWEKYMTINLSQTYDMLIYIDKMSFPTTIEWR
ncbi:MAG: erythromycin esterase family protein [Bacteroidota bacterium]